MGDPVRFGIFAVIGIAALISACEVRAKIESSPNTPAESNSASTTKNDAASAIEQAKFASQAFHEMEQAWRDLGFRCSSSFHQNECRKFSKRITANPRLREALRKARETGVSVFLNASSGSLKGFGVFPGYVAVDFYASDEEIVAFLLGN